MKRTFLILLLLACCAVQTAWSQSEEAVTPAKIALTGYSIKIRNGQAVLSSPGAEGPAEVWINGETKEVTFSGGVASLPDPVDMRGALLLLTTPDDQISLHHVSKKRDGSHRLRHIPLWLSVLPPLVAILLALIFREVIVSLFAGVWTGAFIAGGLRIESPYYFLLSIWDVVQQYVVKALYDEGHLAIMIFSMLIGGMVALISRNGGMAGIVSLLSRLARSPRSAQFTTWLLGVAIFFDDYANTLIVGNTMRPVTDKFRISREKLAYLVDSTAAPVAAVAFITTWIGAQLGYIGDGIESLSGFSKEMTPYAIFLNALPYNFYAFFTLIFMLLVIYTRREFGPMYRAEIRARHTVPAKEDPELARKIQETEDLQPVAGAPLRWYNAFIPVSVVILVTIFGLLDTGLESCYNELAALGKAPRVQSWASIWNALGALTGVSEPGLVLKLGKVIGNSDSYVALLWASLSGVAAALVLTLRARIMSIADSVHTILRGFNTMLPALMILTLAWSLAAATDQLHTATFLTTALKNSINPYLLPALIFILAAGISFSTGSSWSTMAILYPIAIPLVWAVVQSAGLDPAAAYAIVFNVIAVVLSASVLGDHCSPISDTTILSSLASGCPHIDHVRTQLPYALIVGAASIVAGTGAAVLGGGLWVCLLMLLAGTALLYLTLLRFGKKVGDDAPNAPA